MERGKGNVRCGKNDIHADRKLVAKGFLSGVGRRGFMPTGNCLRKVSYSAWGVWYTWRQETIRERFPTRHGESGIHSDRKLFAKGFLYGVGRIAFIAVGNFTLGDFSTPLRCARNDRGGMRRMLFIATGNCMRRVSYPTWDDGIHSDRKLFAKGFLFGVRMVVFMPIGNCSRKVSYST